MIEGLLPDATLLLVDDREENLVALRAVLEPLGHRILTASSGDDALRRLLSTDVSVILLDVQMPGMDGFETASRIKERERTREIPIVFLTALSTESAHALHGFSSGAVDYLTKPVEPDILRAKVAVFVELAQKSELLRQQSELLSRRLDETYAANSRHLRKLADAALAINSTLSLEEMLHVVNDSARAVIGAHEAETVVMAGQQLGAPGSSRSLSEKYDLWAKTGRQADLSHVHRGVLEHRASIRMTKKEIESSPLTGQLAAAAPGHPMLEGWMAVPLFDRAHRALGLIQVADKVDGDFTEQDEIVLLQLAQLASVAIDKTERYEQEHAIAQTLQQSMLPVALPVVAGLSLAARYVAGGAGTQVGGDWYDAMILEDGRVVLAVGDVVGRGAKAAAIMGQLRTGVRAYALEQLPVGVLMRRLDQLLQNVGEAAMATAALAVLDLRTGRLETVLAGHPPPLVSGPTGERRYLGSASHPPLGVLVSPVYTPSIDMIAPGSTLVLYTDGLVESRERSIDDGLEQLSRAVGSLEPATSLETLCDECLSVMLSGSHEDDVALLVAHLETQDN
ncbi:MAG: SpoIIE family protein phosphatase [Acidimicrobiales bacterium]